MGEQTPPYFGFLVSEDKYQSQNTTMFPIGPQSNGGFQLDRQSNASSGSWSDNNCLSTPSSPFNGMPPYDNSFLALQPYDSSLSGHCLPQTESVVSHFSQTENMGSHFPQAENVVSHFPQAESVSSRFPPAESVKHTPSSLGWSRDTNLLKLYTFKFQKGNEPYFQLREGWTPTPETPSRVYLDQAKGFGKNQYPCQYPGTCQGKQNVFGRQADLDRHYKNVHADEKDTFYCDFPKCARAEDPFSRKDHYRDHLRDFHQEDIGHAKTVKDKDKDTDKGKDKGKKKDKRTREQVQKDWLASRKISENYWRCVKCLVRNYVMQSGWECSSCKASCEEDRRIARQSLIPEMPRSEVRSLDTIDGNGQYQTAPDYSNFDTYSSAGWVQPLGSWTPPLEPQYMNCQPAAEQQYNSYYGNTADSARDWQLQ